MLIRFIAFTARGCATALRAAAALADEECEVYSKTSDDAAGTLPVEGPLSGWTAAAMAEADAAVFVSAAGVAVRSVAPFIEDKRTDAAVVCMDDSGRYAIPLLSGHTGGANRLAARIAAGTGALPVITTATDVNGVFAADEFAAVSGMAYRGREASKAVSAALLAGRPVYLRTGFPVAGPLPPGIACGDAGDTGILVSSEASPAMPFASTMVLIPRHRVVGVGCRRGIGAEALREAFGRALAAAGAAEESVRALASIDIKADEPALLALSASLGIPLILFTAAELEAVGDGFAESGFVRSVTGTGNVCERAAVAASAGGRLIMGKTAYGGITVAVAEEEFTLDLTSWADMKGAGR